MEKDRQKGGALPEPKQALDSSVFAGKHRREIDEITQLSTPMHRETTAEKSIPQIFAYLSSKKLLSEESLDQLLKISRHTKPEHIHHVLRISLPKAFDAVKKSGTPLDKEMVSQVVELTCKTQPRDVRKTLEIGIPNTLTALKESGEGVNHSSFNRLVSGAESVGAEYVLPYLAYAIPCAFSAHKEVGKAYSAANEFVKTNKKSGYLSQITGYINSQPKEDRPDLMGFFSEEFSERENARNTPTHAYLYENASINALRGLLDSTRSKDVSVGLGGEVSRSDVFAKLYSFYSHRLLDEEIRDHQLMGEVKTKMGDNRYSQVMRDAESRISRQKTGPIKSLSRDLRKPDRFSIEFHDVVTGDPATIGYEPFKYGLPPRLPPERREAARKSFNIPEGDEVVVVGSPSPMEAAEVVSAFKKRGGNATLIIAPREREALESIKKDLEDQSIPSRLRSQPSSHQKVILLDTQGELLDSYSLADYAFVGENRNILEPASQGKHPYFFGDYWGANQMAKEMIERHEAGTHVGGRLKTEDVLGRPPKDGSKAAEVVDELRDKVLPQYGDIILKLAFIWSEKQAHNTA
ncbi:MAG: hypothetical protein GF334_02240 [Candidatus Altiarchaeales archaeon]|nr:hypothetical protein [Candidatus Altiarchaeales archaeon]